MSTGWQSSQSVFGGATLVICDVKYTAKMSECDNAIACKYLLHVCMRIHMNVVCIRVLHECIQKGNLIIDDLHITQCVHTLIYLLHAYVCAHFHLHHTYVHT